MPGDWFLGPGPPLCGAPAEDVQPATTTRDAAKTARSLLSLPAAVLNGLTVPPDHLRPMWVPAGVRLWFAGKVIEMDEIKIASGRSLLPGEFTVPSDAAGIAVFAHGSGSSRLSPRNVAVARALNGRGVATLLFDLLTPDEADDRGKVFDISLLSGRLEDAVRWAMALRPEAMSVPVGLFGASTGAAAALVVAARLSTEVAAVVSRGGRPDLAGRALESVTSPTLLIVGGEDPVVLELNRQAQGMLRGENRLEVIPGAGHLFEEPGVLERVAGLAADWFLSHF
jgi:putative phosphoribosyl transferase